VLITNDINAVDPLPETEAVTIVLIDPWNDCEPRVFTSAHDEK
jgi:hypothetical protein